MIYLYVLIGFCIGYSAYYIIQLIRFNNWLKDFEYTDKKDEKIDE